MLSLKYNNKLCTLGIVVIFFQLEKMYFFEIGYIIFRRFFIQAKFY